MLIHIIFGFILLGLFILWIIYRYKAHQMITQLKLKDEYKMIKDKIKTVKPYSSIRKVANIVMIIASIYLIFAIILGISILFLVIVTLGMILMAGSGSPFSKMLDLAEFNGYVGIYVLYILLYAVIIKNIVFNYTLYKFLNKLN